MSENIKYRRATSKDKNNVIKLHSLLYNDDPTKTTSEITADICTALNDKLLWVAKINDEVIGYVLCQLFDNKQKYFPNSIFIDGLFVKNEYRKKGVGKKLMDKVLKNKYGKQSSYFAITHDPAQTHLTNFYKSLGFENKGITDAGNIKMTRPLFPSRTHHTKT